MPSKAITYHDMTVTVSANMFGGSIQVRVQRSTMDRTMSADDFAAWLYRLIDEAGIVVSDKL